MCDLREKFTANAEQFDSLMVEMLEENDRLIEVIEGAANMIRGMQMDPSIPIAAKEAMGVKVKELDLITSVYT